MDQPHHLQSAISLPAADHRIAGQTPGESIPSSGLNGELSVAVKLDALPLLPDWRLVLRNDAGEPMLRLFTRQAGADPEMAEWDGWLRQNYTRWADASGQCPVIEAEVAVAIRPPYLSHLPGRVRVGVPLRLIGPQARDLLVRIKPGKVDLVVDGEIVDEEWMCGPLPAPAVVAEWSGSGRVKLWQRFLTDAETNIRMGWEDEHRPLAWHQLQYWAPAGHNRWAGDVMLSHDGERLHLLYFVDRRHHASKGGCGAHHIGHLSTADLCDWTQHPLALPIDEPWETFGTGSLVKHAGQWRLIYGIHSSRVVERARIDNGEHDIASLPRPFENLDGFPMGTAIATSTDGVHFVKERELVHPNENPGVHPDPSGGFVMFAGYHHSGLYRSNDLRHWREVDPRVIPYGPSAPLHNTIECLCHFAWNDWHYLIGGRTGFWMASAQSGPYWDGATAANAAEITRPTRDLYDGLWVPMVSAFGAEPAPGAADTRRRLLAGWLEDPGAGWAGCIVWRELRQEADGQLDMVWAPETLPPLADDAPLDWAGCALTVDARSGTPAWVTGVELPKECLIELTITPGADAGSFGLVVCERGDFLDGCELRFNAHTRTAQWGRPAAGQPAPRTPSLPELIANEGPNIWAWKTPHAPWMGGDFVLSEVEGLQAPLRLRLLVVQDRKSGSVILDAEIGGRRTMITRRRDLRVKRLQLFALSGLVNFGEVRVRKLIRESHWPDSLSPSNSNASVEPI